MTDSSNPRVIETCPICRTAPPPRCPHGHCQVCVAALANGVALCRFCKECFACNGGYGFEGMCNICLH